MSIQNAQNKLKELMDKTSDKDSLNLLAQINADLTHAQEHENQLAKDLKETQNDYKELIKSTSFAAKDDPRAKDIGSGSEGKSFEEVVAEFIKNKK